MLNKPKGTVSAVSDSRMTVIDLIDCGVRGLYPVGRLDRDTEGLLLITNDGPLWDISFSLRSTMWRRNIW